MERVEQSFVSTEKEAEAESRYAAETVFWAVGSNAASFISSSAGAEGGLLAGETGRVSKVCIWQVCSPSLGGRQCHDCRP